MLAFRSARPPGRGRNGYRPEDRDGRRADLAARDPDAVAGAMSFQSAAEIARIATSPTMTCRMPVIFVKTLPRE